MMDDIVNNMSGRPGSNRRQQRWQRCALPTELRPLLERILVPDEYRGLSYACLVFTYFMNLIRNVNLFRYISIGYFVSGFTHLRHISRDISANEVASPS